MMKLAVVIVNYNRAALLSTCLASVFCAQYDALDVIVVDNGSEDGSVEMVGTQFPKAHVIALGYNSGFCKGSNVGIAHALESGADAVVILNNDATVAENFFKEVVGGIDKRQNVGMVAPTVFVAPESNVIDSAGIVITPDGYGKTRGYQKMDVAGTPDAFCPSGAAALYTRELLEDIVEDGQYFDEHFVFYVEEVDLGWRAQLRGWHCTYAEDAVAYHTRHATTKAFPELRVYHANRNVYFNIIKNYPGVCRMTWALILALSKYPVLAAAAFCGRGVVVNLQREVRWYRLVWLLCSGLGHVCVVLPRLLRQRRFIQARTTVTRTEAAALFKKHGVSYRDALFLP